MVLHTNSAEWFEQSSLLIKAQPRTTRITSKYSVKKPTPSKIAKRQKYLAKRKEAGKSDIAAQATEDPATMVSATFELKAFDDATGTCLKYETDKAAEVGRLVGSLGRLARTMAALPKATEDFTMPSESGAGISTPTVQGEQKPAAPAAAEKLASAGTGGVGGKKKKKGKK